LCSTLNQNRRPRTRVAWIRAAATIALMWLAGSALAAPTVLDFEDLEAGTTVNAQYGPRGVIFLGHYLDADPAAHSGSKVLRTASLSQEIFTPIPLAMSFTSPQARVKLFAACSNIELNGTLTAYDASDNVVASDGPKLVAAGAFTAMFEVTDPDSTPSIARAELRLENGIYFAIDDLEFEGEPPAPPPPTPPVVTITSPADGAEADIETMDIIGTVTGEGLLSIAKLTVTYKRPPEETTVPFTSSLSLTGTGTTRQFSLLRFTGVPMGPITVTVEAENFAALKGSATVMFTNLPVPIQRRLDEVGGEGAFGLFRFGRFMDGCKMAVWDRGAISVDATGQTLVVSGDILTKWLSLRTLSDPDGLGCPLSEQRDGPGACHMQDFQDGRIYGHLPTEPAYVPTVFVDVIDQQEIEFPDAGETTVPLRDPVSSPGGGDQQSQTWLFQQFNRPGRLDLQPATLELRGSPPTLWVERQLGTHESQPAAVWDNFACEGNLGPCDVPLPQKEFPPIENAGGRFCGGEALDDPSAKAELAAECAGAALTGLDCGRREWSPIKRADVLERPGGIDDDYFQTPVFGFVERSALAGEDFTGSHEHFYDCPFEPVRLDCPSDWTLDVLPIGPHREIGNHPSLFAEGNPTKMELEYELFYNDLIFWPQPREGDLIYAVGRWIIDCGHDSFRSELHPISMYSAMRTVDEIINNFTGIPEEDPFGGRVATRADIWVNGWYPGGRAIEFDIYPPPRPHADASLIVRKPVDELVTYGLDFEWRMEPPGAANHVHITFNAPYRRNYVTDWGEVKYETGRIYRGTWWLYWSQ